MNSTRIVVVIGPAGSGKSTVGKLLADTLGWAFSEGDQFHPPENVARMQSGVPLGDTERAPWLEVLAQRIAQHCAEGTPAVMACSALKRAYRGVLVSAVPQAVRDARVVRFAYLKADPQMLATRLRNRLGHFFPPSLLESQFADLEEPAADEAVLAIDAAQRPQAIVARIIRELNLDAAARNT